MKRNGAVQKTDGMNSNGPVNRVRIDGFRAIINGSGIQVSGPFSFVYYFLLLILTEVLIVLTNILLSVTPFMMALSTVTVFFLVPGIVAMGIGFGATYPDFKPKLYPAVLL